MWSRIALAAALVIGAASSAVAFTPDWVRFSSKVAGPTPLRARLAELNGVETAPPTGTSIYGELFRPAGDGTFPAVILLHGCLGFEQYHRNWAQLLAGWGYVTLLVDSFEPRGLKQFCERTDLRAYAKTGGRMDDAFGALEYLSGQSFVDADRVGVMGWNYTALTAVAEHGARFYANRFRAAVALYPECGFTSSGQFMAPVLVLAGERDDWAPPGACRAMASRSEQGAMPVALHVYPDALHGFDNPDLGQPQYLPQVFNLHKNPARGATLGYDALAHIDSQQRVRAFLDRELQGRGFKPDYDSAQIAKGVWSVDPSDPGPDAPPVGRSVFDMLFSKVENAQAVYDVPFPFAALVEHINATVAPAGTYPPPAKRVLIPLGRSLQRHAADPEFFKHPRVVLAVDSEPDTRDGQTRPFLKDRLFVGYQEQAAVLEVISYNEQAGRFEFQVVKDYGKGQTPQVRYAKRSVCMSCHQNQGPIFSIEGWGETDNNQRILERLRRERKSFYGTKVLPVENNAGLVDNSTDRANLLQAWQPLWRHGCGDDDHTARLCRANAFKRMLQYRLSSLNSFDARSPEYHELFQQPARQSWQKRWPRGLHIPNPDIPNREPAIEQTTIPAVFDPLNARAPRETWYPEDVDRMITHLSGHLVRTHAYALDKHLFGRAIGSDKPRTRLRAVCPLSREITGVPQRPVAVKCTAPVQPFTLSVELSVHNNEMIRGAVGRLQTTQDYRLLDVRLIAVAQAGATVTYDAYDRQGTMRLRVPQGLAIESLEIEWPVETAAVVNVTLSLVDDFSPLARAIDSLAADPQGVFARETFNPLLLSTAVLEKLDIGTRVVSLAAEHPLPPIELETEGASVSLLDHERPVRKFLHYCATCHRTGQSEPPPFLSGEPEQIKDQLMHCAERIYYRLSMWQFNDDSRTITPMPPVAGLIDHDAGQWRRSGELRDMLAYAAQLNADKYGPPMLTGDYEKTRNCLPGAK